MPAPDWNHIAIEPYKRIAFETIIMSYKPILNPSKTCYTATHFGKHRIQNSGPDIYIFKNTFKYNLWPLLLTGACTGPLGVAKGNPTNWNVFLHSFWGVHVYVLQGYPPLHSSAHHNQIVQAHTQNATFLPEMKRGGGQSHIRRKFGEFNLDVVYIKNTFNRSM